MTTTKRILISLALILWAGFNCHIAAQPQWPAITRDNKPWTRWWWEGSAVTSTDLTAAMEKYSKAGLGGMEITVIYGVKGAESRFIDYLSPKWMEMFAHTLKEGQRLDLGLDLANASGWPFGGPWVEPADACKNINYKTFTVKTGEQLGQPVTFIQQPMLRATGQKPDFSQLVDPVGKSKNLQLYALDQVRFEKPLPLVSLMAYNDSGEALDLTSKVDASGKLNWVAPLGNWTLYALFEGWHGKQVERAGPGGEGDVIDHFSGKAVTHYLDYFDKAFAGYDTKSLRGYFNDSYEVDDAQGQANWTPDMFNEFKTRRGYDLRQNLPALFQKDNADKNVRVLSDYRQTVSELLLEKYTKGWGEWAHKQGKIIRNQSHGSPANILDLYAATDIPETEGTDVLRLKFASSAANVTGKRLTSSESATWLGEHFQSSLSDVKYAIDRYFIGGVNHIFYHGTCFSPENEPWPGWLFYAAVEFTPANSFWNDFPALNSYIARVQSFLQSGKPANDILYYYPVYDSYSANTKVMLQHFDGIGREFNGSAFKRGAELMEDKGYSFDFISDLQLKGVSFETDKLQTGGISYQTIVVPACTYIPRKTFQYLIDLVQKGATVVFFEKLPEDVPGWGKLDSRRDAFLKLKNELKFTEADKKGIRTATVGKGQFLLGNDLPQMLSRANVKREKMVDQGLQFVRRKTDKGMVYFVANRGENLVGDWVPLSSKGQTAAIYNPMNGDKGMAKIRTSAKGGLEVYVQLQPGDSYIIEAYPSEVKGDMYPYYQIAGDAVAVSGKWQVDFTEGGPALPKSVRIDSLVSWTTFGGDEVKNFSGTAVYTIDFSKPKVKASAWMLNLGKVCESARVSLNGKELAVLIGPNCQLIVPDNLLQATNTLSVKVSNLMANRIADLDRRGVEWKKFYNTNFPARLPQNRNAKGLFDASKWQPRESGLIGPVQLIPVTFIK